MNKLPIHACLVLFLAAATFKTSLVYALTFSDDFEASSLNSFWVVPEQKFCTMALSKELSHSGLQSVKFSSTPDGFRGCGIYHIFPAAMKQTEVSVWIYDTAPGEQSLYTELTLWNIATNINISFGITDFSATTYNIGWRGKQSILVGTRSLGWHEFKISAGIGSVKFYLDGALVASFPDEFSVDQINFNMYGFQSTPDSTFYFDDFSLQADTGSNVSCNGKPATIIGTAGSDILIGTNGLDVINGMGGNDGIDGRGGNDIICGGEGDDILLGGAGKNILLGGNGKDTLSGGLQEDRLNGGFGNDLVIGNDGNDILKGDAGDDRLFGGKGDDQLFGGVGIDQFNGGSGLLDICDGGKDTDVDTPLSGCDFLRNFP